MSNWIELLRVAAPMAFLLVIFPLLAGWKKGRDTAELAEFAVHGFLRTSLFLLLAGLLLGKWGLYLPGMIFGLYAVWLSVTLFFARGRSWLYRSRSWQPLYARALRYFANYQSSGKLFDRELAITEGYLFLVILIGGVFIHFLWHPMNIIRFMTSAGYDQTFSLGALVNGTVWTRDGSVALLAPIAMASGLDAATVVRLSVPLVYLMLLCAIAWCAGQYSRSAWSRSLAVLLFWWYTRGPGYDAATAPDGSLWAALFLVLGAAAGRRALGYTFCGLLLAGMIYPGFPELFAVALGCILVALLFDVYVNLATPVLRSAGMAGVVLAGAFSLTTPLRSLTPDGPLQYESSARTAAKIARDFPRNRWLIVSPMHEAAYSTGSGWHSELPQFLERFPADAVRDAGFRFPVDVNDIFIFVEKHPLPQAAKLAVAGNGVNSFYYSTNPGRTSMAFRAGELVGSYAASHHNGEVYFEDDSLLVYRIHQ